VTKYLENPSSIPSNQQGSSSELAQILSIIAERIKTRMAELTLRQRVLAEFIVQNPKSVGFLSITNIAKEAAVSESTIVRFCKALGYEGYAGFSREAQQNIQFELSTVDRFKLLHELSQSDTEGFFPVFERAVIHEMENIAKLDKSIVYY